MARTRRASIAAGVVVGLLAGTAHAADEGQDTLSDSVTESWGDGSVSIDYTITGVATEGTIEETWTAYEDRFYQDEDGTLYDHRTHERTRRWAHGSDPASSRVTASTVRLSGTITATLEPGEVAEVGMLAALWVFGDHDDEQYPRQIDVCEGLPRGGSPYCPGLTHGDRAVHFQERQAASTTLPFELSLEIPPPGRGFDPDPAFGGLAADGVRSHGWLRFEIVAFKVPGRVGDDPDDTLTLPVRAEAGGAFFLFSDAGAADRDDVPGWTIAVGSGTAVLAAAATMAHRRRTDDPDDSDDPDSPDVPHYILQVSHDTLTLAPHTPVTIRTRVWQLTPDGTPTPTPATITLTADPALTLHPTTGTHDLTTTVSFEPTSATSPTHGSIRITATTAHSTRHHTISTHHMQGYRLEILI